MQMCTCNTSTQTSSYVPTQKHVLTQTCVAIFALSELLSVSFVGGIKRPAKALQLNSKTECVEFGSVMSG